MLEVMTRRYYRIRSLADVQVTERSGRPLADRGVHPRRARVPDRRDRGRRARTSAARPTCRAADPRPIPASCRDRAASTSTSPPRGRGGRQRRPRRPRRPDPRQAGPHPAGRRPRRGRRAQAGGDGGGWPDWFTFRRRAGRAGRSRTGPSAAAPDGGRAAGPVAVSGLRADPAARADGRAPVPRPGRENVPDDQRLVALAEVRELTIVRDDAGPDPGAAAARARPRRLPGRAALGPVGRPRAARLDWNRICSTSGRSWTRRSTSWAAVIRSLAPRTGALGLEQVLVQFRRRRHGGGRAAEYCCGCPGRRAPGLTRAGHRTRRPSRCASWTTTRRR